MTSEFLQLEDIDVNTISQSWVLQIRQECLDHCNKIILNGFRVIQDIDSSEENSKKYMKEFAQCLQTKMNDATSFLNTMYDYHLDIIGSLLNKATILENKLGITASIEEMDFTDKSLAEYEATLKLKIDEYQKTLDEHEKFLAELQKKHSFYRSKLGQSPKQMSIPTGKTAVEEFQSEIEKLEKEFTSRQERYNKIRKEIERIVEDHQVMPAEQLAEFRDESIKVSEEMMTKIEDLYKAAISLRTELCEEIDIQNREIGNLWNLLEVPTEERQHFLDTLDGPSLTSKQKLTSEIERLMKIRETKLSAIIENQKTRIQNLWDCCHVDPNTRHSFPLIYSCNYSEEIYNKQQEEIIKWENYFEKHREILQQLEEYKKLKNSLEEMELNTGGAKFYQNRGGILLSIMKKKKVIESRLAATEKKLLGMSNDYLKNNNARFYTCGITIENFLAKEKAKQGQNIEQDRPKITLSPKSKLQVKTSGTTPAKTPARYFSKYNTPKNPSSADPRRVKATVAKGQSKAKTPILPTFKLNQSKTKTSPSRSHWKPLSVPAERKKKDDEDSWTDYSDFEKEVKTKSYRSTSFRKNNN